MTDGDRLIIWFTFQGVHVGNGFPRMVDLKVDGAPVVWPQVHILRVENDKLYEHWAVQTTSRCSIALDVLRPTETRHSASGGRQARPGYALNADERKLDCG